ncbi:hypothetical protein EYB26_007417 [Talaromyces marneffei]|uniref:uncharacterized protein n=1 Tax=Talaromyces marneffei TaxID=37727 RepID=UPI0012AA2569|nr:uncharacterized protein EYB26_007417 [Talaromyces marneffei]QGA19725.1 hypothetical protein EYB26_007417 [Talaromyces marneffei]
MPYTSPLQMSSAAPPHLAQTPVTSESLSHMHTHSPSLETSSASSSHSSHSLPHAHPQRQTLPRSSFSSQSYLRRHRRSPSYSKISLPPAGEGNSTDRTLLSMTVDPHASLRQSPPPRNNAIIPSGAVISPPESAGNSSDEEGLPTDVRHMDLIDAAIRTLNAQKKNEEREEKKQPSPMAGVVPALTPEARKISHSRSSTEGSLLITDSIETSSESDRDGDDEGPKPPMVRKKSGELVRPALRSRRRPSSMPGTPTFSKNVHFDAQLEHIRHFLQLDKPLAVSANTSPVETYCEEHEYPFTRPQPSAEWEIKLPNFPSNPATRKQQPVRLERVFLSPDHKNLVGVVSVANLAFQKHVVARFTVDYWKTVSEVTAEYNHDVRKKQAHHGFDRFDFSIKLSDITDLGSKTLQVCIRYIVAGQEYWDNNDSMNYQIQFVKSEKTKTSDKNQQPTRAGARTLPRSRNNPSTATRPRSMPPASFGEFGPSLDGSDRRDDSLGFRLTAVDSHDLFEAPKPREKPGRQAFGNRYDFGLSLSAARSSGATEDRTTLSAKAKSMSSRGESVSTVHAHPRDAFQSSAIGKPHLESPTYKELVDKYCFFGSPKVEGSLNSSKSNSGSVSPDNISRVDSGVAMNLQAENEPSNSGMNSFNGSPIIFNTMYRSSPSIGIHV